VALFLVALVAILSPSPTFANDGTVPPPTDSMPVFYPDGSLNCANPVNAATVQCTGGTPILPDCSLPVNAVLPACGGAPMPPPEVINQPMYNGDGSVNCANPANATMALCMNLFQSSANGQLDCSRPELQNMPICGSAGSVPPLLVNPDGSLNCSNPINATTIQCTGTTPTSQNCSLPQNAALPICVLNQPMYNGDGSLNCAQPANATMALCMGIFAASETGSLNCALRELQNMPICLGNNVAPVNSIAAPTPLTSNVASVAVSAASSPSVQTPAPTKTPETSANQIPVGEKTAKNKEESFAEAEGEEDAPSGTLSVSFNQSQNRYVIRVDCNLAGEKLTIRAVKKGAKSLKFTVQIDEDGVGGVRTKSKISGFTLTLFYGSERLDQIRVK